MCTQIALPSKAFGLWATCISNGKRKYSWNFSLIRLSFCFWFTVLVFCIPTANITWKNALFSSLSHLSHGQWSFTREKNEREVLAKYIFVQLLSLRLNQQTWSTDMIVFTFEISKLHSAALLANKTQWIQFIELKWRMARDSFILIQFDGSLWIAHIHGLKYRNNRMREIKMKMKMIWSIDQYCAIFQLLFPFVIWFICRNGHAKQYCAYLLCGILNYT